MTKIWYSLLLVQLTGCAVVAEYPVTTASVAVLAATGKGPTDHTLSHVAERDCSTLRVLDNEKICKDYVLADVVDRTSTEYKTTMVAVTDDIFAQRARKR